MKHAFTMIELIFVIVIIGILAAVAIPKLAATRDDAKIATLISHAKYILDDFQAYYASQGNRRWRTATISDVTDVPIQNQNCTTQLGSANNAAGISFAVCNDTTACLIFTTTLDGNLTINNGGATTDPICEAVKQDPAMQAISGGKVYHLGGETVNRN